MHSYDASNSIPELLLVQWVAAVISAVLVPETKYLWLP